MVSYQYYYLLISKIVSSDFLQGEPRDRHIVIVDDLVQTGGTLVECAKV